VATGESMAVMRNMRVLGQVVETGQSRKCVMTSGGRVEGLCQECKETPRTKWRIELEREIGLDWILI